MDNLQVDIYVGINKVLDGVADQVERNSTYLLRLELLSAIQVNRGVSHITRNATSVVTQPYLVTVTITR